jgi:pyrroloquinoline quinone biosynthesis protein D
MITVTEDVIPRFARGVRLREDPVRGGWSLVAPERVLTPNPVAVEILKLCDGSRSLSDIVDDLANRFSGDRERIEADVQALLADLRTKRMVELL